MLNLVKDYMGFENSSRDGITCLPEPWEGSWKPGLPIKRFKGVTAGAVCRHAIKTGGETSNTPICPPVGTINS
jgi:hypothetical protein